MTPDNDETTPSVGAFADGASFTDGGAFGGELPQESAENPEKTED